MKQVCKTNPAGRGALLLVALLFFLPFMMTGRLKAQNKINTFDLKASADSAKNFLAYVADAQVYYFAQNNEWAGLHGGKNVFSTLGLKPLSSSQYAFYCGNDSIIPKSATHKFNFPDPANNWPYVLHPEITVSDFICFAVGNNDKDSFLDVWMINKYKSPTHMLDDSSNRVLIDIINKPFDIDQYYSNIVEKSSTRELSNLYIEINLPAYRLDLYDDGHHVKSYPIAIGMRGFKTPKRTFYLERMDWNPWWYPPNASWCKKEDEEGNVTGCKPVRPGPSNPLGPVKMIMQSSILIHGTNKKWSIGRSASHGCIRMYPKNAIDLAWKIMVLSGTKQKLSSLDRYSDKSRRTYQIALLRPVQVNTIYERLEVFKDKLLLHPDTYRWQPLSSDDIKARVHQFGISLDSIGEEKRNVLLSGNPKKALEIPIRF